jgi:hypothetical protein
VREIRAALKRAERKRSVVVLRGINAVIEEESGTLINRFALPRAVTAGEIKEHVNRANSETEDEVMGVGNGASADGAVRERTSSLASDRGSVTRRCT